MSEDLDRLEHKLREQLRQLNYALGVDEDGTGGMFSSEEWDRLESERKSLRKTLLLIEETRLEGRKSS